MITYEGTGDAGMRAVKFDNSISRNGSSTRTKNYQVPVQQYRKYN